MTFAKNVKNYFVEAIAECKKIDFPTTEDAKKYTIAVIAMTIGMAIILGGLDYALSLGFEKLFLNL